ncbi:MAG: hypothetical protein K2X27_16705, partial [Candidatus Obscuribacterales bacterium]|nr:hypothetical protein [Candidatus Obscuribacterales bacterium]
ALHHFLNFFGIAHIKRVDEDLGTKRYEFPGSAVEMLTIAADNNKLGSASRHFQRHRFAEPGATTGDDRYLTVEVARAVRRLRRRRNAGGIAGFVGVEPRTEHLAAGSGIKETSQTENGSDKKNCSDSSIDVCRHGIAPALSSVCVESKATHMIEAFLLLNYWWVGRYR